MKNNTTKNFKPSVKIKSLVIFLFTFSALQCLAQGNLMIFPMRAVFDGRENVMELNLSNSGMDTARYVISMIEIRMKQDGSFETITLPDEGQNFASKYVRVFPRSVMLAPKESQTVKLQLNKASQLAAGEYRSHLYFRAVPNQTALGESTVNVDSSGISVKLTPVYGLSIPVIVRIGENNTKTTLSDPKLVMQDTIPVLSFQFKREGNMSTYGDLKVDYINDKGKTITVGEVKGIAVYTPNTSRIMKMALPNQPEVDYKKGRIHISYEAVSTGRKPQVLAETYLNL